jgi:hypothetical protein
LGRKIAVRRSGKTWIPVQFVDIFLKLMLKSELADDPQRYAESFQSMKPQIQIETAVFQMTANENATRGRDYLCHLCFSVSICGQ